MAQRSEGAQGVEAARPAGQPRGFSVLHLSALRRPRVLLGLFAMLLLLYALLWSDRFVVNQLGPFAPLAMVVVAGGPACGGGTVAPGALPGAAPAGHCAQCRLPLDRRRGTPAVYPSPSALPALGVLSCRAVYARNGNRSWIDGRRHYRRCGRVVLS
jgi:hypothetical protein